jgi:hypothetical protein
VSSLDSGPRSRLEGLCACARETMRNGRFVELLLRFVEGSWWLSFGMAHFEADDGIWMNRVGVLVREVRRARSSCGDGECIVDETVDQRRF